MVVTLREAEGPDRDTEDSDTDSENDPLECPTVREEVCIADDVAMCDNDELCVSDILSDFEELPEGRDNDGVPVVLRDQERGGARCGWTLIVAASAQFHKLDSLRSGSRSTRSMLYQSRMERHVVGRMSLQKAVPLSTSPLHCGAHVAVKLTALIPSGHSFGNVPTKLFT